MTMSAHTLRYWLVAIFWPAVQCLLIEASRDFPLGSEVENLALRPSGSILATVYTSPHIYEVMQSPDSTPRLLHVFQNTTGACGIAESSTPDVFFVVTGNFSFENLSPIPWSYAIHRLAFEKCGRPIVEEIAALGTIAQPNGMTAVPNTPYVLIADSYGGFVYRFNTETLQLTTYLDHPLLKPQPVAGIVFGVNGVKLSRGHLYFSNSNQQIVARIKATGTEVALDGGPEIVAISTPADDFIVNDLNGDVYIAQSEPANGIGFVSKEAYGSAPITIAGGPNSTALLGPTAAIWAKGAEGQTLIVSVTGGFEQFFTKNYTGGGKVAIVHLE
ncbi:hypothetical protein BU23DRAFT_644480 [Bimuria novae-zelandiae CBS 107.79]|uniref:SMP-30/Gluconolactonase/LRE-like region domain-containing protein n=1 Tax=Bimuria novae-zelandiae CBS 107.79 TaxID=1447943 RepID=A0A6A5V5C7_9PLEO|nr:hypothetical protein BU23DRAFT_644480 [Bimuria novae-zelandiae CBS 107.79]